MLIMVFVWFYTIGSGFLGLLWSSRGWLNCFVKFLLIAGSIVGTIILYQSNGFSGVQINKLTI